MPEICDAACQKIIINSRLMAPIADVLAEEADLAGHALFRPARLLALATRAACAAYDAATEQGALVVRERAEWKGCAEATYLMRLVEDVRSRMNVDLRDANRKISEWTDRANRITSNLVRMRE